MTLNVPKEESIASKIQDANTSVIEKHFHGEVMQDVLKFVKDLKEL